MQRSLSSPPIGSVGWLVLIYRTASATTQYEILLRLESFRPDLCALGSSSAREHFVIIECASPDEKDAVHRLITAVDRSAELVHVADPTGSHAVAAQMSR